MFCYGLGTPLAIAAGVAAFAVFGTNTAQADRCYSSRHSESRHYSRTRTVRHSRSRCRPVRHVRHSRSDCRPVRYVRHSRSHCRPTRHFRHSRSHCRPTRHSSYYRSGNHCAPRRTYYHSDCRRDHHRPGFSFSIRHHRDPGYRDCRSSRPHHRAHHRPHRSHHRRGHR